MLLLGVLGVGRVGGGCATFIREDISFREVSIGNKQDCLIVEIGTRESL